jgi:2-keto-3-deoxy-L-fuconate dehydrogenase
MRLTGKTALVTAAGQGIGKASALALAAEGATVWATDVNEKLLASYAGVPNIHTAVLDVMDKSAIQKRIGAMPAIDVLFNCAGFVHAGTALDATDEQWDFAFDLNVRSQFWTIQAALPHMLARQKGSIINMASVVSIKGLPNRFVYGASKAALINMAETLRIELEPLGLRVQVATPGFVETPAQDDNGFPKPFMISATRAAQYLTDGLKSGGVELSFPRRFTWMLKALYALPKRLYIPLVRKQTGWDGDHPDWPK